MFMQKWVKGIPKGWLVVIATGAGVSGAYYNYLYVFFFSFFSF